jgi:DNA invertase Pin-like site-specific DNA recombinase
MGGMKYGYARTSTDDQTTALQLAALKRARCPHVYEDKGLTGAHAKYPALSGCLRAPRAGDTPIAWKLDRLGRSLRDLITMLDDLRSCGVRFGRKPKRSTKQIDPARKLIDDGQRREDVAAPLNVDRTTFYRAM